MSSSCQRDKKQASAWCVEEFHLQIEGKLPIYCFASHASAFSGCVDPQGKNGETTNCCCELSFVCEKICKSLSKISANQKACKSEEDM